MSITPLPGILRLPFRHALVVLLYLISGCARPPSPVYAPDGRLLEIPEGAQPLDLYSLPGQPVVDLPYLLIEELPLPEPVVVLPEAGESYRQESAWRLTVSTSERGFGIGALPWFIWVADVPLLAIESQDLKKLYAVTLDPALVQAGAEISVSYGLGSERRTLVAVIPPME